MLDLLEHLIDKLAAIITAASRNPRGMGALLVTAAFFAGLAFFHGAPNNVKLTIFCALLAVGLFVFCLVGYYDLRGKGFEGDDSKLAKVSERVRNRFDTNQGPPAKLTGGDTAEASQLKLKFSDAFIPDPVTVHLTIENSRKGGSPSIEWPTESNQLVSNVAWLREQAGLSEHRSSPFADDRQSVAAFLKDSDLEALSTKRDRIEARLPYTLEALTRSEADRWTEEAYTSFLRLANFELHWPLALTLLSEGIQPWARAKLLPHSWRVVLAKSPGYRYENALAVVMGWPWPLYRQNVMKLSGQPMNRYFLVPRDYCRSFTSVTDDGFVRCIVPRYELALALEGSRDWISYDGKTEASKTLDENGRDVYP